MGVYASNNVCVKDIILQASMVLQNYQNLKEITSNIFHIVAFGVGFKCPHKINLNTQCHPPDRPGRTDRPTDPIADAQRTFDRPKLKYDKQCRKKILPQVTLFQAEVSSYKVVLGLTAATLVNKSPIKECLLIFASWHSLCRVSQQYQVSKLFSFSKLYVAMKSLLCFQNIYLCIPKYSQSIGQSRNSYTFSTMPIMLFSPVSNCGDQSLGVLDNLNLMILSVIIVNSVEKSVTIRGVTVTVKAPKPDRAVIRQLRQSQNLRLVCRNVTGMIYLQFYSNNASSHLP